VQYLLLISADEDRIETSVSEDGLKAFWDWYGDLERRGVLKVHAGLHPSDSATTVRVRDGQVLLTDGPYAEGREQVGGLAIIDCDDLDEAIDIAARHPATAWGQVEIRPVRE
jgi:hypothetical protein